MVYFASYFALFFALGALLGFVVGYLYRGPGRAAPVAAAQAATPALAPADELHALAGMTPAVATALAAAGVGDLAALRTLNGANERLQSLADELRLEDFALRKWVGMAGLQGIEGIDADLAHALQRVAVRNAAELAAANPDRIQNKLAALHDAEALPAQVPDRATVAALIERAAAKKA